MIKFSNTILSVKAYVNRSDFCLKFWNWKLQMDKKARMQILSAHVKTGQTRSFHKSSTSNDFYPCAHHLLERKQMQTTIFSSSSDACKLQLQRGWHSKTCPNDSHTKPCFFNVPSVRARHCIKLKKSQKKTCMIGKHGRFCHSLLLPV